MPPPEICSTNPVDDQNPGAIFSVMKSRVNNPKFIESVMKFLSVAYYLSKFKPVETVVHALV
jgi:hypothetical protein